MPELPDVEAHRSTLQEHAVGQVVRSVRVNDPQLLEGTSPAGLGRSLSGRTLTQAVRHGKWLWACTDDGSGPTLVFHFRMSGELVVDDDQPERDALTLVLDRTSLAYRTQRRLGGVTYLRPGAEVSEVTGPLGPDATEVDRAALGEMLEGRRGMVKPRLMDQRRIAGLGNELVDEILWRSGIHPRRSSAEISHEELRDLHRELRSVVNQTIRAGHVPSGTTWLNSQRSADDARCPRCGRALTRARVGGRTTLWCPREQA